jgi:hypothetical protein
MRHPNRRVRAAAAEILHEMAKRALVQNKSVFDREMAGLVFNADLRIRTIALGVAELLDSANRKPAAQLDLVEARGPVRSVAPETSPQPPDAFPLAELPRLLADPERAVRQAALRAFLAHGREGRSKLYEQFLKTEDKALRVQILEELDRAGLLPNLLQRVDGNSGTLERRVVELIVSMGATRYLQAALTNVYGHQLLQVLFAKLEDHSPHKIDAWLGVCDALKAFRRTDPTNHGHAPLAA